MRISPNEKSTNPMRIFIFVHQKSRKLAFKTVFFGTQCPFVFVWVGREN